jgi:uncharacterized protein
MATVKIFHHNDADGRCAAAIAAQWCNERGKDWEFIEVSYKERVPVERVMSGDYVFIVDFSFIPYIMNQILLKSEKVVWCDHHVTARDYDYGRNIDGVRDFANKGLSGCECTWKYVYPLTEIPEFVKLLGDYDAWRLEYNPECFEFYEGLKLLDTSPDGVWTKLLEGSISMHKIIQDGKLVIKYRDAYCTEMRNEFAYVTKIDGFEALAMNVAHFGSKQFGDSFHSYPVCIAYIFDGTDYTVSLYSEVVDVGEIAKKFGGGGHQGAAGFVCEELPFYEELSVKQ